jgi:predicted GNAT family N-acyltransferase
MQLKSIDYGSEAYNQAALLRYRLFYQEHNIPFASIFDPSEKQDFHLAITDSLADRIFAYGRLGQNSDREFQIYQMVVEPDYQGRGLGGQLLQGLLEEARGRGANLVVLKARVTKVQFYKKFGFQPVGEIFASAMTGVPHIHMQLKVEQFALM